MSAVLTAIAHGAIGPAASITESVANFCTSTIGSLGLAGIFVLMLLDCACIPIPSEVTMLFGGFAASQGRYGLVAVILAGTLGNVAGSWLAWGIGRYGAERLQGRRGGGLLLHANTLDRSRRWFDRYGAASVLFSRMLPLVRTFISLPAGFARMGFVRFTLFTALGCLPWVIALAVIGDAVGSSWPQWKNHLQYLDYAVVAAGVAVAAVIGARVVSRRLRSAS